MRTVSVWKLQSGKSSFYRGSSLEIVSFSSWCSRHHSPQIIMTPPPIGIDFPAVNLLSSCCFSCSIVLVSVSQGFDLQLTSSWLDLQLTFSRLNVDLGWPSLDFWLIIVDFQLILLDYMLTFSKPPVDSSWPPVNLQLVSNWLPVKSS